MKTKTIAAAFAAATSAALLAPMAQAATYDVVTGGSATFTFTADFDGYFLGTNWDEDAAGNPSNTFTVRASGTDDLGYPDGTYSQVIDGGASLSLRRASVYIFPLDSEGNEVESYAEVKNFNYREDDPSVTDEMKDINYVPTGTAGEYTDFETGETHYLTPEQEALLEDGELRLCCRHTLGSLEINTAAGYVDGVIDNIAERDINFDGVIDENDDFVLFDLEESGEEGIFNLVLSGVLADYLNYGFTPDAFADGDTLAEEWGWYENGGQLLTFAAGDVVGSLAYSYETGTTTPVPVPAALPLLAGGIGAMSLLRARRKRAAA